MTNKAAAARYARALLDVAVREKADLDRIERELGALVDLFRTNPALEKALVNPVVPVQRKRAAMGEIAVRGGTLQIVGKLVALLAERDRLALVPDLAAAFRERLLDYRGVVRADITTNTPLAPDRARAIEQGLARATGRTVKLSARVDPAIIGGVVTRLGSTVYDASLKRQLDRMRQRLGEGD